MKRNALAILLHPYKNALYPRALVREGLNGYLRAMLELADRYRSLRWNLALPGYVLELADPLILAELRELHKREALEWLLTGYTEPFFSFSPRRLSRRNIALGRAVYEELTGVAPTGFVSPFSHWEPSHIDILLENGIQYVVLAQGALPRGARPWCGYWMTEHLGSSIPVFGAHVFHHFSAPPRIEHWLSRTAAQDPRPESVSRQFCIDYLMPLVPRYNETSLVWLQSAAEVCDRVILNYRSARLGEILAEAPPIGIQSIPPCLMLARDEEEAIPYFLNYLHTFDQVGLLQRRMMDVAAALFERGEYRRGKEHMRDLFFVQDINRFLPGSAAGACRIEDRVWCYKKLVSIDRFLHLQDRVKHGQIRITDYLKNGSKSIVMANNGLKICIDHKCGGRVFGFDVRAAGANLCAVFSGKRFAVPGILDPAGSLCSFVDHALAPGASAQAFVLDRLEERGDFSAAPFDYTIKKTDTTVKVMLRRQGTVMHDGRPQPVHLEKMLGLEKDRAELLFGYSLTNHAFGACSFSLCTMIVLALPGVRHNAARLVTGSGVYPTLGDDVIVEEGITRWTFEDTRAGMAVTFTVRKAIDLWCRPLLQSERNTERYQGVILAMRSPVDLEENGQWSLAGKIRCSRKAAKPGDTDAI